MRVRNMDYKEKYEKLHRFVKDLYPHMSEYCKEKVEGYIPELAESEDEKIHKLVIKIVNWYDVRHEYFTEIPKEKVMAWLEKQGEKSSSKEEVGVAESPSKTFPRVNEFETGSSYRR